MRNYKTYLYLSLFFTGFILPQSCGNAAKTGARNLPKIMKTFGQNAGKNSAKLAQLRTGAKATVTTAGRLIPEGQAGTLSKVKIPLPGTLKNLGSLSTQEGSQVAKSNIKNAKLDLVLFDAVGNPIVYADPVQHKNVYSAAERVYRNKAVSLTDEILEAVNKNQVKTEAELQQLITKTVGKSLGTPNSKNPVIMDVGTGSLTFNVEFQSGSQIVGSMNIYDVVKKSTIVGIGGYYLKKNISVPLPKAGKKQYLKPINPNGQ